jgi:hypothetical protein
MQFRALSILRSEKSKLNIILEYKLFIRDLKNESILNMGKNCPLA